VNVNDLSDVLAPEVNLSGLVRTLDGRWIFASSSGEMFVVRIAESGEADVETLGNIGHSRVESLAYSEERSSLVALCSDESGDLSEGSSVLTAGQRGAVVIARISENRSSAAATTLGIPQMVSASAPRKGTVTTSIRRPCNVGR
jgi:hypothetical protein